MSKIRKFHKEKVPYEASITWGETKDGKLIVEKVNEKETANVNGRVVEGPVLIIRKWGIRAVAICPHGVDRSTGLEFLDSNNSNNNDESQSLMTKEQVKQFMDAFGAEHGMQYLADGLSFDEAQQQHQLHLDKKKTEELEQLKKDHAALVAENKTLKDNNEALKAENATLKADHVKVQDALTEANGKLQKYQQAMPGITVIDSDVDSSNRTDNGEKPKGAYRDAMTGYFTERKK